MNTEQQWIVAKLDELMRWCDAQLLDDAPTKS